MSEELTVEQIVATYIKLRRRKEAVENEVKENMLSLEVFRRQEIDRLNKLMKIVKNSLE